MNELKLTSKTLAKLSLIINKMGISSLILEINVESENETADKQEVVKKLIALIIDNLYKAEDDITTLVADLKGITKEEAENVDLIPIIKDLFSDEKIKSFLKRA